MTTSSLREKKILSRHITALIGADPGISDELGDLMELRKALRLVRFAELRATGRRGRRLYLNECVDRARRIQSLECWLERHTDPYETLPDFELRELDQQSLAAYMRMRNRKETELAVLKGVEAPYPLFVQRVGAKRAFQHLMELFEVFDAKSNSDLARVNSILLAACKATVKYPSHYIEACIKKQLSSRKRGHMGK